MMALPLIVVVTSIIATAIVFAILFRGHRRELTESARRWSAGTTMTETEFLKRCEISEDPTASAVALAARESIAALAGVPDSTVLPDHSFARDLSQLPYWDSLDWLGFIFEIERRMNDRVKIPLEAISAAQAAAGGWEKLCVRHVVRAVSLEFISRSHVALAK